MKTLARFLFAIITLACISASPPLRAQSKSATSPKRDETQITVYVTKTGTKYHRAGCSYLRRSAIPTTLKAAKARYTPCSRCHPPQ
jgi:micrococcal nuclease